jgi:hypothetical protein
MPVEVQIISIVMGALGSVGVLSVVLWFKLKKNELEMRGGDPKLGAEVDALRDDLNDTRAQLAEMQERLDFAERVLTAGRASQQDRSG